MPKKKKEEEKKMGRKEVLEKLINKLQEDYSRNDKSLLDVDKKYQSLVIGTQKHFETRRVLAILYKNNIEYDNIFSILKNPNFNEVVDGLVENLRKTITYAQNRMDDIRTEIGKSVYGTYKISELQIESSVLESIQKIHKYLLKFLTEQYLTADKEENTTVQKA
jgi:hypothetical protein